MHSIAIVNYGMGNVHSVQKAVEYVAPDARVRLTNDAQIIDESDRVVFPGQGAMGACMRALGEQNLVAVIQNCAADRKPFLGICLGLQLLFDQSEENNQTAGLGIIPGTVVKFRPGVKIPHIGWNNVRQTKDHPLWHKIENGARFYNTHSYYVRASEAEIVAGITHYGVDFTSAIAWEKLFAVQFHPEKSQKDGLQLLKNFIGWS